MKRLFALLDVLWTEYSVQRATEDSDPARITRAAVVVEETTDGIFVIIQRIGQSFDTLHYSWPDAYEEVLRLYGVVDEWYSVPEAQSSTAEYIEKVLAGQNTPLVPMSPPELPWFRSESLE